MIDGPKRKGPARLRHRILLVTGAGIGGSIAIAIGLVVLSERIRSEVSRATESYVEEQRIADRISLAVTRQIATISAFSISRDPTLEEEFRTAGEEAYKAIRAYLFRDLSATQRRQLESAREALQRLEATATQTVELVSRGEDEQVSGALGEMSQAAFAILEDLNTFMGMREAQVAEIRGSQDRTFRIMYGSGLALAMILLWGAVSLAWFISRRVARPLEDLTRAARRIGRGELDVRVADATYLEFSEVASGFNRMAENLDATTRSLERRNRELEEALERERATHAELIQTEKLSALGRLSAGLAHELNNPLSSVLGYAQLLVEALGRDDPVDRESLSKDHVEPILREARRAGDLVRNFLTISRRGEAELRPVRLDEVVRLVVDLRRYAFEQEGLAIAVEELPGCPVVAESQQLHSVFLNILNNAFDAMEDAGSGTLTIRGERSDETVRVTVEDDGPGLVHPERVFEPFYTTKPVGAGTGLGLSLVHRSMELFGGSARAENREGGGARLLLDFAVASAAESAPSRSEIAVPIVSEERVPEPTEQPPGDEDEVADTEGPTILVVEDEEHVRRLQERVLGRLEGTVLVAESAETARRLLLEHRVDAVVSDVRMPGESGIELYHWVRREQPRLAEHFLFVTGDIDGEELGDLARSRPDIFVRKPFELDEYLAKVLAVLEG